LEEFREERQLERPLQEGDATGPAGTASEADDTLDRLHVAEAPELETFLDIDQFLGEVVRLPVVVRILVDALVDRQQAGIAAVRLRPVPLQALGGHVMSMPCQPA